MGHDAPRVSEEFPELFHYTTIPAFESIYASQTFWATHYSDLNDSSELLRFRLKVHELAAPIIADIFRKRMQCDTRLTNEVTRRGGIDAVVNQEAEQHLNTLHRVTFREDFFRETFICSFCAHAARSYESENGLLSQWRAYATGGGIAIVLDTASIEDQLEHEAHVFGHPVNHIGDVKYDDDDIGIRHAFRDVFDRLPGILQTFYSGQQASYDEIVRHFVQGCTLVKHHAFHEENEIRIVVSPTAPSVAPSPTVNVTMRKKLVHYRRHGHTEARYIELFWKAAMTIGRILRRADVLVMIGKAGCHSACVLVLAGAPRRAVTGPVGIHRPYPTDVHERSYSEAQQRYRAMEAEARRYLEEMNLPASLFDAMARVPPETVRILSREEIDNFGLDRVDPVTEDLQDAEQARRYGLDRRTYLQRKARQQSLCLEAGSRYIDSPKRAAEEWVECRREVMEGRR